MLTLSILFFGLSVSCTTVSNPSAEVIELHLSCYNGLQRSMVSDCEDVYNPTTTPLHIRASSIVSIQTLGFKTSPREGSVAFTITNVCLSNVCYHVSDSVETIRGKMAKD